jgi:hypothetical protein
MQNTKPAPHEQIFSTVLGFWRVRALAVATEYSVSPWRARLSDIVAIRLHNRACDIKACIDKGIRRPVYCY